LFYYHPIMDEIKRTFYDSAEIRFQRLTMTTELNHAALNCSADELPDIGRQWAKVIDTNTVIPGDTKRYPMRVLRMLSGVQPRALPHTVLELDALLASESESEELSKQRRNLRSLLGELTVTMFLPGGDWPTEDEAPSRPYSEQTASQLGATFRSFLAKHSEKTSTAIDAQTVHEGFATNDEIDARLALLRQTPVLGQAASEQPRNDIEAALEWSSQHRTSARVLAGSPPDILAKVLTVKVTGNPEALAQLDRHLGDYRVLLASLGRATDPSASVPMGEDASSLVYSKIRDQIAALYAEITFDKYQRRLLTFGEAFLQDDERKRIRAQLALAADWLLLHERLDRRQLPYVL
jgi:hypothetical protein